MKRPDPSMLIVGATAAATAATVFVGVGGIQLSGQHHADIWSNIWIAAAIAIAAITIIVILVCITIGIFARRAEETIEPDAATPANSSDTKEAREAPLHYGQEAGSQGDMMEKSGPSVDRLQTRRKQIVILLGTLSAMAAFFAAILVFPLSVHGGNSGSSALSLNPAQAAMPQKCTRSGPLVFIVSGRQDSPGPAMAGAMVSAAVNAVDDGSPIGLVNLDGRPQLVAAGALNAGSYNAYSLKVAQNDYLHSIASAIYDVRATSAHADVLDALQVAAEAIRAACDHGGTVYLVDSGLQETGAVNFRKPGLLSASPAKIAAQLSHEHELPHLQAIKVVLVGVGDTALPQQPLSIAQQYNLIAIWSAIAKAAGAIQVIVNTAPRDGPAPTHVPPVQLVPTQ